MSDEGRILIVVSVDAQKEAVQRGIGENNKNIDILTAGVGVAKAAAATAFKLAGEQYKLVINAGIAGGFTGRAEIGTVVLAEQVICADLGAESDSGFLTVDELGFGSGVMDVDRPALLSVYKALEQTELVVNKGEVLTLSTVTGTKESTLELMERYPDALAEAMEGFGVASACALCEVPFMEMRTISNAIGPRDREAWRIKEALLSLEEASKTISEVV
uniref:Futalosine hydrolase n=1 Tax=Alkalihalophilus pseudofirmus TaxID=79885 RepID=Q934R5_ALKPS|nr:hypothetical 23.6 kDa protein [Alkalihalophilus pseudofirmus OF4]